MNEQVQGERRRVYVCLNEDCMRRGNAQLYAELKARYADCSDIEICEYICFSNCENGANVVVYPDRVWFDRLRAGKAHIVEAYLRDGTVVPEHSGQVEEEVADTIYELLELMEPADQERCADEAAR